MYSSMAFFITQSHIFQEWNNGIDQIRRGNRKGVDNCKSTCQQAAQMTLDGSIANSSLLMEQNQFNSIRLNASLIELKF